MSEWQVGDLALCVANRPIQLNNYHNPSLMRLVVGAIYTVVAYAPSRDGTPGIILSEVKSTHPSGAFNASRFRKVTPGTDIEGVEERRRVPVGEPA